MVERFAYLCTYGLICFSIVVSIKKGLLTMYYASERGMSRASYLNSFKTE